MVGDREINKEDETEISEEDLQKIFTKRNRKKKLRDILEEGEDKDNQPAPPAKRLRGRSDTLTKDEDNDDNFS